MSVDGYSTACRHDTQRGLSCSECKGYTMGCAACGICLHCIDRHVSAEVAARAEPVSEVEHESFRTGRLG